MTEDQEKKRKNTVATQSKMKSMNGIVISSKDILAIIKQCSECNVVEIKIKDLHIKFDKKNLNSENSIKLHQNYNNFDDDIKTHNDEYEESKITSTSDDLRMLQDSLAWENSIMQEGDE